MALAVTFSMVWLPATVVTAVSSSSGLATASISAIASSWPGSQSMISGVGIAASSKRARCSGVVMLLAAALLTAVIAQAPNPSPPAVSGTRTESTTTSSAVVDATVDPNGADTTYHVDYGTTAS